MTSALPGGRRAISGHVMLGPHCQFQWVPVPVPLKNWQCLTVSCHSLSDHRINQLCPFCRALCVCLNAGGRGLNSMQLHSKHKEAADFLAVPIEEYIFFTISKPAFKMALAGIRNQYPLTQDYSLRVSSLLILHLGLRGHHQISLKSLLP